MCIASPIQAYKGHCMSFAADTSHYKQERRRHPCGLLRNLAVHSGDDGIDVRGRVSAAMKESPVVVMCRSPFFAR